MNSYPLISVFILACVVACDRQNPSDGVWTVTRNARLVSSEHVYWLPEGDEPEPPAWIDTYALRVEDGPEIVELLWTGTAQNPFDLEIGDRITINFGEIERTYSEEHDGYYVSDNAVRKLPPRS